MAAGFDQILRGFGGGQPFLQDGGGEQRAHRANAAAVGAGGVQGAEGVLRRHPAIIGLSRRLRPPHLRKQLSILMNAPAAE